MQNGAAEKIRHISKLDVIEFACVKLIVVASCMNCICFIKELDRTYAIAEETTELGWRDFVALMAGLY